ncbi:MAG: hypothetical protein QM775_27820 [Pirellulales bacterium]
MPEVLIEAGRLNVKLSPQERLKKHVRDEAELADFHQQRADAARQRMRNYQDQLAALGANPAHAQRTTPAHAQGVGAANGTF